ncbi:hypothetical protein NX059_000368 [Plenodomus lindquistii]|nr:hypothetical protein NX059_000368 [Plenodomus lindquistii]
MSKPRRVMCAGIKPTTQEDIELAHAIGTAKYDLSQFIEDGDDADREIQELQAESLRLGKIAKEIEDGDPRQPVVRLEQRARALRDEMRRVVAITEARVQAQADAQAQAGAMEYASLQAEHRSLQEQMSRLQQKYETLRKVATDFQQMVEGSSGERPTQSMGEVQTAAGTQGLWDELQAIERWVEECGGKENVEKALRMESSAEKLPETMEGPEKLQQ